MAAASLQQTLRLTAFACVVAGTLSAADVPKGRPIEFSTPRDERGETNKPSAVPGRMSLLDQMEADLNRPLKSLRGDSLGGVMLTAPQPLPPPVINSPRAKELIERKRDKWYQTPEEMFPIPSLEDASKKYELTPDGRRKSELRPLELRMMEAFNPATPRGLTNQSGAILSPTFGHSDPGAFPGINSSSPAFGSAPVPGKSMEGLFGEPAGSQRARDAIESRQLFGFGQSAQFGSKPSAADLRNRETFKAIIDANYVAPIEGAAPVPGTFSTPYVDSSFYDPPKPAITPSLPKAMTGSAASPSSTYMPSYVPPAPAPVKPTPPPAPASPFMNIPRRNF